MCEYFTVTQMADSDDTTDEFEDATEASPSAAKRAKTSDNSSSKLDSSVVYRDRISLRVGIP